MIDEESMYDSPQILAVGPYIHKKYNIFLYENIETLYHYTNLDGFLGIVENCSFWASHIKYLNDSEEYHNGINTIHKVIQDRLEENPDKKTTKFLEELSTLLGKEDHEIFVVSFCSNGDLLSQWRGYAQNEAGVSLGFSLSKLCNHTTQWVNEHFYPFKVIYDDEIKYQISNDIISIGIESVYRNSIKYSGDSITFHIAELIIQTLRTFIPLFKHSSFSEEKEWRFVKTYFKDSTENIENDIRFRVRNKTLLPFIEAKLYKFIHREKDIYEELDLPLSELIVGPSKSQNLTLNSVDYFLKSKDLLNTNLEKSKIPFRW